MAKKKIKIDKTVCIGCASCVGTDPDDIKIGDDGLAEPISGIAEEDVVEICPVGAISVEE